jgi:leucyl/phenylalanyl-tRNA--protein transferase
MSDLNDIVAVGLDLTPKTLINAYSQGVFPWPTEGLPLLWYCPTRRAIVDFSDLRYNRRLKQYLKKSSWTFTVDQAFTQVLDACSERGDEGTWITDEMKAAYTELHKLGHAHSVEVWNGEHLVGGVYGVDTAGYFAGESMFHREDHASKAALLFAIALQKKAGREWMDIQILTPHMEALGAKEISRAEFKKKLTRTKETLKLLGPSEPFRERERFSYCDFSMLIE